MPRISNIEYKKFRETGLIEIIQPTQLQEWIDSIEPGMYTKEQARALLIILYYSGRRPSEIILLKRQDITREPGEKVFWVTFPTKKKGISSTLAFRSSNKHLKEFYDFAVKAFPFMPIFNSFQSKSTVTTKWKTKNKEGGFDFKEKSHAYTSHKVGYWVKKWTGKPPYYFRHSRMSQLAKKGATAFELMHFKGAKDLKSVNAYVHMSQPEAKKLSKMIQ